MVHDFAVIVVYALIVIILTAVGVSFGTMSMKDELEKIRKELERIKKAGTD